MHDEDAPPAELEARVAAVVLEQPAARAGLPVQGLRIADVVAVDEVNRQPVRQSGLDRLRADEIAAMDHCLGTQRFGFAHCLRERVGAVVAVRNDADLHPRVGSVAIFRMVGDCSRCAGDRQRRFAYAHIECPNPAGPHKS
jgi:hypothetical protein